MGIIFDIKEFSIQDGPGIRTTVFLKGCPLRCIWCHNPEGQSDKPELMIKHNLCVHCGKCLQPCDHRDCAGAGRCLHICPNGLISRCGREITPEALAKELLKNADFLKSCGGGVTFSGGEPLRQADFLLETMAYLKDMHVAVETCGYASEEVFRKVADKADYLMMDLKLADSSEHRKYTGVDNKIILDNFKWLKSSQKQYIVRTPLIPEITDTSANLAALKNIIGDAAWEKLEYNGMAGAKYRMLGREYPLNVNY